jgi:undecaprenyl-diphosphatase
VLYGAGAIAVAAASGEDGRDSLPQTPEWSMTLGKLLEAALLGLLEGMTEFIPVSSTGHLLLAGYFLGFQSTGKTFEVLIQLGAILAVVVVYFTRLWRVFIALPRDPAARRFAVGIVIAFLPAAVTGATLHGMIKEILFETPALICTMLIIGGVILFVVDRMDLKPRYANAMEFPPALAFKIGLCQTLSLIPGVSRAGSTMAGALLLGVERRAAAEFSFFLAIPTMLGAFVYDLYQNWTRLSFDDGLLIFVGFAAAFCAAIIVVRTLLDFVARNGFAFFALWRIVVGGLGLVGLLLAR